MGFEDPTYRRMRNKFRDAGHSEGLSDFLAKHEVLKERGADDTHTLGFDGEIRTKTYKDKFFDKFSEMYKRGDISDNQYEDAVNRWTNMDKDGNPK